jgi:small-conductance mechanosensitive channel
VGINLTTLSVFGGALGVGLGFGLQKIASNYVSGFIILLDHSIRLGNIISVGDDRGQVTRITTRFTVLRSLTGIEAIVPNEQLISSVVRNESYTDRQVRVALPVQVGYDSDLELAMRLLAESADAQPRVMKTPAADVFVKEFADSGINLELGFWIADPENGFGKLRSDINLAIWHAFKQNGIQIPYPQREIRILGEKNG